MGKEKTVEKSSTKDAKKSSKDDKKSSKKSETEETQTKKVNRNTDKAQLDFDVNPRKTWVKDYVELQQYKIVKKDKDTKKTYEAAPMLSGIQFGLTVADQITCDVLVNACVELANPTTEGLYQLTSDLLCTAVKVTPELNLVFGHHLSGYQAGGHFKSLGIVNGTKAVKASTTKDGKEVKERAATSDELTCFVEKCINGGGNTKVSLSEDGKDFLCYLLGLVRKTLTDSAVLKVQYAGKKGLDIKSVSYSVRDHYSGAKNFCKTLCAKIDEVEGLVDEANKEERSKKPAKKTDSETKDTKSKKNKDESKAKKDTSKTAKKEESEEEEESDEESGSDSGEESD